MCIRDSSRNAPADPRLMVAKLELFGFRAVLNSDWIEPRNPELLGGLFKVLAAVHGNLGSVRFGIESEKAHGEGCISVVCGYRQPRSLAVSYTHLRAHETVLD